jgi:hypothetical protein
MAGNASRENGKKGGRPKGFAALEAERQRIFIAEKLEKQFSPIVSKAIELAKKGDRHAREWLTTQAYGKVPEHLTVSGSLSLLELAKRRDEHKLERDDD